jgi:protein involved in polysaccharide export with SLBB domain
VLKQSRSYLAAALCGVLMNAPLSAQSASGSAPNGNHSSSALYETRSELVARAQTAETQGRSAEASLLRSRLQRGDFQEGDRIVVVLENNPKLADTLQVRAGRMLQMPRMSDLSLEGVLRSEIGSSLESHLSKYLRNPALRATPLLPIAVLGSVRSPGYYYTSADVVLRDLLMRAGGPANDADLDKMTIRRSGDVIWKASDVRAALSDGMSLDRLHLHAGDEVLVPRRRGISLTAVVTALSATTALVFAINQIAQQ